MSWRRGLGIRLVAAAAATLLSGCWMAPGFSAHRTGTNVFESRIGPANVGTLVPVWSTGEVSAEVVRSGTGRVHSLAGDRLTTYDFGTGDLLWTGSVPLGGFETMHTSTLLAGMDDVVVPDYQPDRSPRGCVFRYAAASGAAGSCIPFPTGDEHPGGALWLSAARWGDWIVVVLNTVSATSGSWTSRISVTHLSDPSRAWTQESTDGTWVAGPIVVGDRLYVARSATPGGASAQLEGWDLAGECAPTCTPELVVPYDGLAPSGISATADGQRLAIADSELVVVDLQAGEILWTGPGGTFDHRMIPTWVADKLVVVAPNEAVRAFAAAGCGAATCAPVWEWRPEFDPLGRPLGQPAGANGLVYVATNAEQLVALPVDCGDPCDPALILAGLHIGGPPIVTDGKVLYNGSNGLTALALAD